MISRRAILKNLMLVVTLFAVVGVAIAAAKLRAPYVPREEPPELVAKRLDKENNAYYGLIEAAALLPQAPHEIGYVKDEAGMEIKFKPQPGSVSALLNVWRPDNDPLLLDYIEKSKPAVQQARNALSKPFFHFPPANWQLEPGQRIYSDLWNVEHLKALMVLDAATRPCSEDPAEDACRLMQQALGLSFKICADRHVMYEACETFAVDAIRESAPGHQREMLQWLDETRAAWTPNLAAVEYAIRKVLEGDYEPDPNRLSAAQRIKDRIALSKARLFVRRHEDLYREAALLTSHQFRQQEARFKQLQTRPHRHFNMSLHSVSVYANSRFFARVDGLRIAIALEMYRSGHGAYPDSLTALAPDYLPEIPKSPYDGQDFDYQRVADDYRLSCRTYNAAESVLVMQGAKLLFHEPAPN